MDSLLWLASCLEQGRTAIAPTLADAGQRGRIERLKHIGALAETRARAVICPWCEAHGVDVIADAKLAKSKGEARRLSEGASERPVGAVPGPAALPAGERY